MTKDNAALPEFSESFRTVEEGKEGKQDIPF